MLLIILTGTSGNQTIIKEMKIVLYTGWMRKAGMITAAMKQ